MVNYRRKNKGEGERKGKRESKTKSAEQKWRKASYKFAEHGNTTNTITVGRVWVRC